MKPSIIFVMIFCAVNVCFSADSVAAQEKFAIYLIECEIKSQSKCSKPLSLAEFDSVSEAEENLFSEELAIKVFPYLKKLGSPEKVMYHYFDHTQNRKPDSGVILSEKGVLILNIEKTQ